MSGSDRTTPPLDAATGVAGEPATEAFSLLANDTRIAILLALWDEYDPYAGENSVPYSTLLDRVGTRDSGQFNYHLGKLTDHFVEKTDEGYQLRNAGLRLIQTVIAGAGVEDPPSQPTETSAECYRCGAPTAISYRDEWLYWLCTDCEGFWGSRDDRPNGMLAAGPFDPAGFTGRTPIEAWNALRVMMYRSVESAVGGVCKVCSGPIERSLDICRVHGSDGVCNDCGRRWGIMGRFRCPVCKDFTSAPPLMVVNKHPAVVAFYHERGVPIQYDIGDVGTGLRAMAIVTGHEQELVSEDPPRVRVTVDHDGDGLELTLDEELNVIEVIQSG